MTIGDVLAVIAAVLTLGTTLTATIVLLALAFPARTCRAQQALTASPGRCLARGAGVLLAMLLVAGTLGRHPAGPIRLLSWTLWAGLGALAALGSAGIARLLGERISQTGAVLSPFSALARGAGLSVLAGALPFIGWLFVAPATVLLALGCGTAALERPKSVTPVEHLITVYTDQSEAVA